MISSFRFLKQARYSSLPKMAALVRVKNEARALNEFWRRLSAQTIFSEMEVICLDSGSCDGTLELLQQLPVSLCQISPEDFSFGSSCNLMMSISRAPVAVFLSGHVLLQRTDALEQLYQVLVKYEHAAGFMRQVPNLLWGASIYEEAYLARRFPEMAVEAQEMRSPGGFSNAGSVLTRASWMRNQFPEIRASEDFVWAENHLRLGGKLFYFPRITVMHSHSESPDCVFERVRLNASARGIKGSWWKSAYYFGGVLANMIRFGAAPDEAWLYAAAHARAYLPQNLDRNRR